MRTLMTCILFSACVTASFAQDFRTDSLSLLQTLHWLEDKLTYNYYNMEDDEWWINRFGFNQESQTITIKNIASPHLESVTDKTYLQLNFRLEELNPFAISILEQKTNAGRLVKGKIIKLEAYDKSIKRVKNGRLSTNQSFIYISVPEFFEDSIKSYSQNIVSHLDKAIRLSTKLYNKSVTSNTQQIEQLLYGSFSDQNGNNWNITPVFEHCYEIARYKNSLLTAKYYLHLNEHILLTTITPEKSTSHTLKLQEGNALKFKGDLFSLEFLSTNEIIWTENQNTFTLTREWDEAE